MFVLRVATNKCFVFHCLTHCRRRLCRLTFKIKSVRYLNKVPFISNFNLLTNSMRLKIRVKIESEIRFNSVIKLPLARTKILDIFEFIAVRTTS